jgi:hypothetical protein
MTGLRGKIGATEERDLVVWCEEHREWPAPGALHQELMSQLVDLVEIGAFFSIDFDVDEVLIHYCSGRAVVERLVRHHVAPVTGRIAY